MATVTALYRYPVKGLRAESLPRAAVAPGGGLPLDRLFAIAHGDAPIDWSAPQPVGKRHFLQLLRNEGLWALSARYDEAKDLLVISRDGSEVARGHPGTAAGRAAIESYFAAAFAAELRGAPRLVRASQGCFADRQVPLVSLIGLGSVRALAAAVGAPLDPLRFRANVYFDDAEPWAELGWSGRRLRVGEAVVEIIDTIGRCAATNVNLDTGRRDQDLPQALAAHFGHSRMGAYARVVAPGAIAPGDPITPA
jgi:hypothetical protein